MKLRNKKTGEIVATNDLNVVGEYESLTKLTEEWEDYIEEPNYYWFISECGAIGHDKDEGIYFDEGHKELGNYFKTKEEAEKAVERLRAWKRLKDKGFRFYSIDRYEALCGNGFNIPITATMPPEAYTDVEVSKDLDLLFSQEDD